MLFITLIEISHCKYQELLLPSCNNIGIKLLVCLFLSANAVKLSDVSLLKLKITL
jgi:hypothetical protein